MSSIGIIYGSNGGNTEHIAEQVKEKMGAQLYEISDFDVEKANNFDCLIFATSTWGAGDLCNDWELHIKKLEKMNLDNKLVSFIGLGDQFIYGNTFCDALRIIYDEIKDKKIDFIGAWPLDGYDYGESRSVLDGKFLGLIIDEDNQPEMTDERIDKWVSQVNSEILESKPKKTA